MGGSENEYAVGWRVSAKIQDWKTFYKGIINKVNPDGTYEIRFDDGDLQKRVGKSEIKSVDSDVSFNIGDRFQAQLDGWDRKYQGTVKGVSGKGCYKCVFDDGEEIEFCPADLMDPIASDPVADTPQKQETTSNYSKGTRVSVSGSKKGVITAINSDGTYKVTFDNGKRQPNVPVDQVRFETPTNSFDVGARIEAKIDGWDKFYAGVVEKIAGEGSYKCKFDDGEVIEFLPWDLMRPETKPENKPSQEDTSAMKHKYKRGTRVSAKIQDWTTFYKGVITALNDDGSYKILFDDGDVQKQVMESEIQFDQPLARFEVGQHFEAQLDGWDKKYKGVVEAIKGDGTYKCKFEDGEIVKYCPWDLMNPIPDGAAQGKTVEEPVKGDPESPEKTFKPDQAATAAATEQAKIEAKPQEKTSTAAKKPKKATANHKYQKGFRVSAKMEDWSTHYDGVVAFLHPDGTYKIKFDDGEVKVNVKEEQMKYVPPSKTFAVGDRIEAKLNGWDQPYAGTVAKIAGEGSYKVKFDDGDVVFFCPWDLMNPLSEDAVVASGDQEVPMGTTGDQEVPMDPTGDQDVSPGTTSPQVRTEQSPMPSSSDGFQVGDRCEAIIEGWDQFYKGVVSKVLKNDRCQVTFDDGDIQEASFENIKSLNPSEMPSYGVGDTVEAKLEIWNKYFDGTITKAYPRGGSFQVKFSDGEVVEFVPFEVIREGKPKPLPSGTKVIAKLSQWKEYYPGVVLSANRDGSHQIQFDDGEVQEGVTDVKKQIVEPRQESNKEEPKQPKQKEEAFPVESGDQDIGQMFGKATDGDESLAPRKEESEMEPEQQKQKEEEERFAVESGDQDIGQMFGKATDGDESLAPPTVESLPELKLGDRVSAQIEGWKQYYSGIVLGVGSDETVKVKFDDGEVVEKVPTSQVQLPEKNVTYKEEERIEAKLLCWDQYYPGKVIQAKGRGTYEVLFDDGEKIEYVPFDLMKSLDEFSGAAVESGDQDIGQMFGKADAGDESFAPEEATTPVEFESNDGDESIALNDPVENVKPTKEISEPKKLSMNSGRRNGKSTSVSEVDDFSVQVLECRFRAILSGKSRNREGKIDVDRCVRHFLKLSVGANSTTTTIDQASFTKALSKLGLTNLSEPDVSSLMSKFGTTGKVTAKELESYITSTTSNNAIEEKVRNLVSKGSMNIKKAFRKFDVDASGTVTKTELVQVFNEATKQKNGLTLKQAESIIAAFDVNNDGMLDEKEFLRFVFPQFSLFVMTPIGQIYISIDPNMTLNKLKGFIKQRIAFLFNNKLSEHERNVVQNVSDIPLTRAKLARHYGKVFLEPPVANGSMSVVEALVHGEQIYYIVDKDFVDVRKSAVKTAVPKLSIDGVQQKTGLPERKNSSSSSRPERKNSSSSSSNVGGAGLRAIAEGRLRGLFDCVDDRGSGYIPRTELIDAIKNTPKVRNLLRGSAPLKPLLQNPVKVVSSLKGHKITFRQLASLVLPPLATAPTRPTRKESCSSTKAIAPGTGRALWETYKAQARVARNMVNNLKESGVCELSQRLPETIGEDQARRLSQFARRRLMTGDAAPKDMQMQASGSIDRDAMGNKLKRGGDPEETQQWVNSLSSDKWLGHRTVERKRKEQSIEVDDAFLLIEDEKTHRKKDPFKWSPSDVKLWLQKKLELTTYLSCFLSVNGKELLTIYDDEELIRLGVCDRNNGTTVALQRKKILANIEQLRQVRRRRKGPGKRRSAKSVEAFGVCDVIDWLLFDMEVQDREIINSFKQRKVDGTVLSTLSSEDLQSLLCVEDESLRDKMLRSIRSLFPEPQPVRKQKKNKSEMDDLILGDIENEIVRHEDRPVVARGNAQHAVRALKMNKDEKLRTAAGGMINTLLESSQNGFLRGGSTGRECVEYVESLLERAAKGDAPALLDSWFEGESKISRQTLWNHMKKLAKNHIPRAPFDRMWSSVFKLDDNEDYVDRTVLFREVFGVDVVGTENQQRVVGKHRPSTTAQARVKQYMDTLSEAISRVRIVDFSKRSDREMNAVMDKLSRAKENMLPSDIKKLNRQARGQLHRLEDEFDRVIIGKY